jgi:hypothetical protein
MKSVESLAEDKGYSLGRVLHQFKRAGIRVPAEEPMTPMQQAEEFAKNEWPKLSEFPSYEWL